MIQDNALKPRKRYALDRRGAPVGDGPRLAFLSDVMEEVRRASVKFPKADGVLAALTEEVGEAVDEALVLLLHVAALASAHGSTARQAMDGTRESLRAECVQVAAMAMRLALEDDPTLASVRAIHGKFEQ